MSKAIYLLMVCPDGRIRNLNSYDITRSKRSYFVHLDDPQSGPYEIVPNESILVYHNRMLLCFEDGLDVRYQVLNMDFVYLFEGRRGEALKVLMDV